MGITVAEMIRHLQALPPELELVAIDEFEEDPERARPWTYAIGTPYRYGADPVVTLPIKGIAHPLTQQLLDSMHPELRKVYEADIALGKIPFDPKT